MSPHNKKERIPISVVALNEIPIFLISSVSFEHLLKKYPYVTSCNLPLHHAFSSTKISILFQTECTYFSVKIISMG
nr:MAG TPA: hypothetical protein [Caudoviricetes sp.]